MFNAIYIQYWNNLSLALKIVIAFRRKSELNGPGNCTTARQTSRNSIPLRALKTPRGRYVISFVIIVLLLYGLRGISRTPVRSFDWISWPSGFIKYARERNYTDDTIGCRRNDPVYCIIIVRVKFYFMERFESNRPTWYTQFTDVRHGIR